MRSLLLLVAAALLVFALPQASAIDQPCESDKACPVEEFCQNQVCVAINVSCSYDNHCYPECARAKVKDIDCRDPTPTPSPTPRPRATPTPVPAPVDRCNYPVLEDRVSCRTVLPPGRERDFEPEDCRRILNETARRACGTAHVLTSRCISNESYAGKIECARAAIGIKRTITRDKVWCEGNQKCLDEVAARTYALVKFRFDVLQDRARLLGLHGASHAGVVAFTLRSEELRAEFDAVSTIEAKKDVLLRLSSQWDSFKKKAAGDIKALERN